MTVLVSAFYKFVSFDAPDQEREWIEALCQRHGIRGTILLAREGINGTISGAQDSIDAVLGSLRFDPRLADLVSKHAVATDHPFRRLKVKVKPEIVTFGVPEADPSQRVGTYVPAQAWNALIRDPDVVVVDTRNAYEVRVGTFSRAIDPGTRTFAEFPAFVKTALDPARHPRIAMFCTGGIRCEKASAYLLAQGFPEVYHLEGGILKYLEQVAPEASLFAGECFVFDERVAVDGGLAEVRHRRCVTCGQPLVSERDGEMTTVDGTCSDCRAGGA